MHVLFERLWLRCRLPAWAVCLSGYEASMDDMGFQDVRAPRHDSRESPPGRTRFYEPLVLRDSRCRFIVDCLRETHQQSPIHVNELVDQFLIGELPPIGAEELPAVRRDVYSMFSQHCLLQLEAAGLVVYDRFHDTVQLR